MEEGESGSCVTGLPVFSVEKPEPLPCVTGSKEGFKQDCVTSLDVSLRDKEGL